jgi:hypothetical protein
MKFTVRSGFVVHITKLVTTGKGDKATSRIQENSYYEGETIDLDAATALDHLHKLEPGDDEAVALMSTRTTAEAAPVSASSDSAKIDALTEQLSQLAKIVAAAVAPEAAPTK